MTASDKVAWSGLVISVQPRIRLMRSFDQRTHNYLGYVLSLAGSIGAESREFSVAIGNAAHAKHGFAPRRESCRETSSSPSSICCGAGMPAHLTVHT